MRTVLWSLLPVLALVLLAAHFLYGGWLPLAVVCLTLVVLVFVPRPWAARSLQVALTLGALEWFRRAWELAGERLQSGQPYLRMLLILGAVALFTAAAAWAFQRPVLRDRFRLGRPGHAGVAQSATE